MATYAGVNYGAYQFATSTYAWTLASPTNLILLALFDSITSTDSDMITNGLGFEDIIKIEEWFTAKLDGPNWASTSPIATTWNPTNPSSTTWTPTTPPSTTWTPVAPITNPWTEV
jgi:hypothetical protein